MPKTVTFLRHAETEGNRSGILMGGRIDTPLTSTGKRQAEHIADLISDIPFDKIYCSPNSRAQETLLIALPVVEVPVETVGALGEQDYGLMSGTLLKDIPTDIDRLHAADPYQFAHAEGESLFDLQHRIALFLRNHFENATEDALLLVTHENVIKAAVGYMKNLDREISALRFANCSLTQYQWKDGYYSAMFVNRCE